MDAALAHVPDGTVVQGGNCLDSGDWLAPPLPPPAAAAGVPRLADTGWLPLTLGRGDTNRLSRGTSRFSPGRSASGLAGRLGRPGGLPGRPGQAFYSARRGGFQSSACVQDSSALGRNRQADDWNRRRRRRRGAQRARSCRRRSARSRSAWRARSCARSSFSAATKSAPSAAHSESGTVVRPARRRLLLTATPAVRRSARAAAHQIAR